MVVFSDLPTSPLLTLGLDVPHTWLVEPVFSPYDLDNIHLAEVPEGVVHAVFILEHILVEGQYLEGIYPDYFYLAMCDTYMRGKLGYSGLAWSHTYVRELALHGLIRM